jgi:hypothetical protein
MRTIVKTVTAVAIALLATVANAGTITWNFNYSGSGITASGTLTTTSTLDSSGAYDILGITGKRTSGGVTKSIAGLLPSNPTYNDNELFMSGALFDQLGVGFAVGATQYDLYFNSQSGCGTLGYREDNGSAFPYCSSAAPVIANVSVTRNVPEPGTLALMTLGLGLVLMGQFLARRRAAI